MKRIQAERGKPLVRAEIEYDWHGRANFTRRYAASIVTFVMRSFMLDEQLEEANSALEELCQHYLDNPEDIYESHSFHWSGALYCRLWEFFSPMGTKHPGRMSNTAQVKLLELMWAWLAKASNALNPEIDDSRTWRMPNSENHHAMGTVTCWGFARALKEQDGYASRKCEGGGSPKAHFDAWTRYFKEYFRQRSMKGLNVEIASKGYNSHTLQMWLNVFDFAEDDTLRNRAQYYLDLYWATWAEEQIECVRGGAKTRIYQGPASRTGAGDSIGSMAKLYLGIEESGALNSIGLTVATSSYRMPLDVMKMALDPEGRGDREITQRCQGLAERGYVKKPGSGVVHFGVTAYRTDFGGFLRYTYSTPDFVMGTLMLQARPCEDWTGAAKQNRWQGVTFRGHKDALIFPECMPIDTNSLGKQVTMNQHWSVQKKGSLIFQKLGPGLGGEMGNSRVWFSEPGLGHPLEEDGWVFVEAEGAYAAVRPVSGGYSWDATGEGEKGQWLHLGDDLAPVVLEVALKRDHADFLSFRKAVRVCPLRFENAVLTFSGLSGDRLTFYADFSQSPAINGKSVDFGPTKVFDSPFLQSEWDSGVVKIGSDGKRRTLDFNAE